ncbi:6-hydroxymethylpterin diphosphokinase MptE-like protein [Archaeoglobus sp.]
MRLYEEILQDFGFSREDDERAAKIMKDLAGEKLLDCSVLEFVKGKSVAVIGGAYSGESVDEEIVITAGKAVNKVEFTPHVHVTDMEEDEELLAELEEKGCVLVLHAHGDNIDRIRSVVPKVRRFVGTTQSIPFDRIYNFGGFTDGDRAALIAKRFGARSIKLYGFDFESADNPIKLKKLKWAKIILKNGGII